jgi:Na+/H+ antiporter NhaC
MDSELKQKITKLYDYVHVTLWSLLAAFVIFFAVYAIPHIGAARAQIEATRILEIAAEHEALCTKLAMGTGTLAHDRCIRAVQEFRAAVEKRISDDLPDI